MLKELRVSLVPKVLKDIRVIKDTKELMERRLLLVLKVMMEHRVHKDTRVIKVIKV